MPETTQICPRCGRTEAADSDFCYCGFIFAKAGQRGSSLPPRAILASGSNDQRSGGNLVWQCGHASVAAPFVALLLSCMTRYRLEERRATAIILIIVYWGLLLFGLVAAIIALVGIRRRGPKGLLIPGLAGLLINGGFIAAILYLIFKK